jgi:hypothetical protein
MLPDAGLQVPASLMTLLATFARRSLRRRLDARPQPRQTGDRRARPDRRDARNPCTAGDVAGSPDRIRTGVTALRGRRPRPLDDGAVHSRAVLPQADRTGFAGDTNRSSSAQQTTASGAVGPTRAQDRSRCKWGHSGGPVPNVARTPHSGIRATKNTANAGVPGLEPRLTGPEPVGLPITPYPKGTRRRSSKTIFRPAPKQSTGQRTH